MRTVLVRPIFFEIRLGTMPIKDAAQTLTKRFAVTLPIAFVLLFHSASSCRTSPDSQVANRLEAYLKPFVDTGNFTGCVLVASKSRVLFRRSYGMANYELHVPNSPETRFHITSTGWRSSRPELLSNCR